MRIACSLLLLVLAPTTALAWGDECKFRADRAGSVDAKGVEKVVIRAGAGDMKVIGRGNAVRIEARGNACAAKQELLDATQINVRREGNVVYVETALPQNDSNWHWGNNDYAYIDLGIALPTSIPVEAVDSSGDATFEEASPGNPRHRRLAPTDRPRGKSPARRCGISIRKSLRWRAAGVRQR